MDKSIVYVGAMVEFVYNDKVRRGVVDKVGVSKNGEYFTLQLGDGSFKSFTVSKCQPTK